MVAATDSSSQLGDTILYQVQDEAIGPFKCCKKCVFGRHLRELFAFLNHSLGPSTNTSLQTEGAPFAHYTCSVGGWTHDQAGCPDPLSDLWLVCASHVHGAAPSPSQSSALCAENVLNSRRSFADTITVFGKVCICRKKRMEKLGPKDGHTCGFLNWLQELLYVFCWFSPMRRYFFRRLLGLSRDIIELICEGSWVCAQAGWPRKQNHIC